MAPPRRRKKQNQDLPDNVYPGKTVGNIVYYYYEHPITQQREWIGTDKQAVIRTGHAINNALMQQGINPAEREPVIRGVTVSQAIKELEPKMLEKLKPSSQKETRAWFRRLNDMFGRRPLKAVTVRELSEQLEPLKDRPYIRLRWHMIKIYEHALARGYIPHNFGNPAKVLAKRSEPKAERERLTLGDFKRIHAHAPLYLQTAMDLMLSTTLRPVDIVNLRFDQVVDDCLHSEVRKSSKFIRIELGDFELSVIKRARDSVASPYIVHYMPQRKGKTAYSKSKDHPTQLTVDYLSRKFSAIRNELGIGEAKPPTLYEIRSLSRLLYEEQGRDPDEIRKLMAHTNQAMTDYYLHDRRKIFITVKAGLKV